MRMICGPALSGLALAFSCGGPAAAHDVDLSLNSHAVRVSYGTPVGDGLRLEGGWLHDSDEGDVAHAGVLVTGSVAPANQKLTGGVGVRLAYLAGEGNDREGYALGVGGALRWSVPRNDRLAVSGEWYWAPDILSGGDSTKYVDGTVRVGYRVLPQAEVYVGARYVGADYDNRPSIRFDTGMHAGFNLRF